VSARSTLIWPRCRGIRALSLFALLYLSLLFGCERRSRSDEPRVPKQALSAEWGRATALAWRGRELWTGHEGGWLARWSAQEGGQTYRLSAHWLAHEGALRSLELREGGGLMSLGGDGSWARWDPEGRLLLRGRAPELRANAARALPDGSWLIASDRGVISRVKGGARLWRTAGEHRRAAFALALDGEELLSVGSDGWLRRWRTRDGSALGGRAAHQGWATALLKMSPPQADRPPSWVTGGADGYVRLWPHEVASAPVEAPPVEGLRGHSAELTRLAGAWPWVVSGGEGGKLSFYELTGEGDALRLKLSHQLQAFEGPVMSLVMSGGCVIAGGGQRATELKSLCYEAGAWRTRMIKLLERGAEER